MVSLAWGPFPGAKLILSESYHPLKGTSKNWTKPTGGLPSNHEKVSPGAGFVWTSQLYQDGERQFFEGP